MYQNAAYPFDVSHLRIPVNTDAEREKEAMKELWKKKVEHYSALLDPRKKRERFIDRINEAKSELGVPVGGKVTVGELFVKMGYKTKNNFMNAAIQLGLRADKLCAMNIEGIKPSRPSRLRVSSVEKLDSFIIAKKDELGTVENLDSRIFDIIKEVRFVILGMVQGEAVYYYGVDDIQRNINKVAKGIFEKVMSDINSKILNSAVNCLSAEDAEGQLKEIESIMRRMEEARDKVQNYIFKLKGDSLISVVARLPDYKFYGTDKEEASDRDKIEDDIRAKGPSFLERIEGRIEIEGKSLLNEIDALHKAMEVVLGATFAEMKEFRDIEFSNGLLDLEGLGEGETVFPVTRFLNKDKLKPVITSMPRKSNPIISLGIPGLIETLDAFVFNALKYEADLSEAVIMKIDTYKDRGVVKVIIRQGSSNKKFRDSLAVNKKKFDLGGPAYLVNMKKRKRSPAFRSGLEDAGRLMNERPVCLIYKIGQEEPFPIEVNLYVSREATSFSGLDEIAGQDLVRPTDL